MKSVLRFLIFVVILFGAVLLLYFTRTKSALPVERAAVSTVVTARFPALEAVDREFTELVSRVLPSVVSITAIPADTTNPRIQYLRRLFGFQPGATPPQLGSGVIVSPEGLIVTNFHVIQGAGSAEVTLNDGRVLPAKFLGADIPSDIAILQIAPENIDPISWGNSDDVKVGQMVFAVGNPLGLQETVTQGIISARGRRAASEAANEFFQTDAAINRGNSGGPLVSLRGELIGINNMVPAQTQTQGIAFSIPANTVRRVFESIRDHGRFIRPWFGVSTLPLSPMIVRQLNLPSDVTGALVQVTQADSPAEKAGIESGDVIVEYGGKAVRDAADLRNRVVDTPIGDAVEIKVLRAGRIIPLKVTISPEPGS